MYRNIIPAVCAVIVTILLASFLSKKNGVLVTEMDIEESHNRELPAFWKAILGPVGVSFKFCVNSKNRMQNNK